MSLGHPPDPRISQAQTSMHGKACRTFYRVQPDIEPDILKDVHPVPPATIWRKSRGNDAYHIGL